MTKFKALWFWLVFASIIVFVLIYLFIGIQSGNPIEEVYFVSKTSSQNSTFWHSVERGVKVAGDELGLKVTFLGPEREIDLDEQIDLVKKGIMKKPIAIILAASDYNALSEVSKEVISSDITFLTVDSDVDIVEDHSFIASDNVNTAKELGEILAREIENEITNDQVAEVGIISHLEGTTSSTDRIQGFKEGIMNNDKVQIIDNILYSNNEVETALEKTKELISENPDIKGIFGTNEATLIGIAMAIDELELKDEIKVVGFDISDQAARYIEKGVIHTIVIQRPFNMGYLSVKEAYNQYKYGKESETIYVDIVFVTKENMFDEEIQKFLIPFLE